LGAEISDAWAELIADRDIGNGKSTVRYAAGQPMGFLSSWAVMAVTHHIILNYCTLKLGKDFSKVKYLIIGDDMTVSDQDVARMYRQVMDNLGVEISEGKSLSPDSSKPVGEIAKRLFIDGEEISPIPPNVLVESTGSLYGLLEIDRVLQDRGYYDQGGSNPPELRRDSVLDSLLLKSRVRNSFPAQLLLGSPFRRDPPLSRVRSVWEGLGTPSLEGLYNRYLLGVCSGRIDRMKQQLTLLREVEGVPGNSDKTLTPIIRLFVKTQLHELAQILEEQKRLNDSAIYGSEPIKGRDILEELLCRPGPEDIKWFSTKREIRVKKLSVIIFDFHKWITSEGFLPHVHLPRIK
jgi:hypothetical protein